MADRVGWLWLKRLPRTDLRDRGSDSWRDQGPDPGLTWGVELTGDAFIEKASRYGMRGTVVEVGPGYGRLPAAALKLGVPFERWLGIDLSEKNVAHLRERFPEERFTFVVADAETIALEEPVDTIISSLTLKHVFPDFGALLANLAANLRGGGVVVIDLIEGRHRRHFEPLRGNFIRSYTRPQVEEIFARSGLDLEAFDEVQHSPDPEHRRLLVVGRRRAPGAN